MICIKRTASWSKK